VCQASFLWYALHQAKGKEEKRCLAYTTAGVFTFEVRNGCNTGIYCGTSGNEFIGVLCWGILFISIGVFLFPLLFSRIKSLGALNKVIVERV